MARTLKPIMPYIWGAVALVTLGAVPTLAQELAVRWSAYLFNSQSGALVRVFQDGAQSTYNLGLPENTFVGGYDLAFSGSGERAGFCTVKFPDAGGGQGVATLAIRDIEPQVTSLQLDLGKAIGCRTGHHAFSADDSQLAVARVNYYPGDPSADTSLPSWQITVLDMASGSVLYDMNSQTPAALEAGIAADQPMLPYVQYFANHTIIFMTVPYGIGGASAFPAYIWNLDTGSLEKIEHWGNTGLDALDTTGELIWLASDPDRAAANPGGPLPANNELRLADKSGQERVIYYTPDWVLVDAHFINGGQQIAIQEVPPFDPNSMEQTSVTKWVALDRAGNLTDLQAVTFYQTLVAAPQGYAVLDVQYRGENQTQPHYTFDWHANGGTVPLWSFDAPDPTSGMWEVTWAAFTQAVPDLSAFPTFGG